jgi:hypothetical protein
MTIIGRVSGLLALPAALFAFATPSQASLYGNTISCSGTGGITCSSPSATAGTGVEFTITDTNLSPELGPTLFTADFTQNGLSLSVPGTPSTNGFTFLFLFGGSASLTFADNTTPFTSAALASSNGIDGPPGFTVSNGNFTLPFGPVEAFQGGEINDFTLATATTPLPAALPLFAGGLGMLGLLSRRRKRKAHDAFAAA